jgi:hypothetical protein
VDRQNSKLHKSSNKENKLVTKLQWRSYVYNPKTNKTGEHQVFNLNQSTAKIAKKRLMKTWEKLAKSTLLTTTAY